jgi:hypothetical protein
MSLHAMSDLARGFGVILDHLGFEVLHNETDVSFLTSDNPVVCFDPTVPEGRVLLIGYDRRRTAQSNCSSRSTQRRFFVATQG